MMELTKKEKEAVDKSVEQWEWIVKTEKGKADYFKEMGIINPPIFYCYLCQYQDRKDSYWTGSGDCPHCPYFQKFGGCLRRNSYYCRWEDAKRSTTKKKYAALFLEQLKEIKGK